MTYLLDTSFLVEHFRRHGPAEQFIKGHLDEEICTSAICEAELNEGIYREKPENIPKRLRQKEEIFASFSFVVPFDSQQADIAGKIRAELSLKGDLTGDLDILIAAAALARDAVLVTRNAKHFQKIAGLQVENI
jgi:tRNA(fMet)-specific endonuclease VapC